MMHELQPGDPRLIGSYRLRGRLGAGGMGRVYLGLSPGGRAVAVKVIRDDLAQDPEFRARFRREIAVARKVSGLFTAPVIDADVDGPVPWLVTAYVGGPSLADAVSEHGPLPVGAVLKLAAGLAEGLAAIHGAGVVHRDLKPANVLLAEDGPRVIDFGISRAAEASALTHTGLVVGSPGFMSPEQAEGREVGPPSDIFSLGAVLAFAASGQGPFGTGLTPALVYRAVHSVPSLDLVPAEVRPLVERCLAKDPARRPSAGDLLAGAAAYPGTGWLPEAVTEAFSLGTGAAGASAGAAGAVVGEGAPVTVTAAGVAAVADPVAPAWPVAAGAGSAVAAGARSAVASGARSAAGSARPRAGRGPWRGRWRPLTAAAVLAGLAGAGVTAGFAMTASSAPTRATQSVRQEAGSGPSLAPAYAPSYAPAYAPASSASPAPAAPDALPATAAPNTSPSTTGPTYTPPPAPTAPPATTAPPTATAPPATTATSAAPSPKPSPSPSSSSCGRSPAPGTSSPAPGEY